LIDDFVSDAGLTPKIAAARVNIGPNTVAAVDVVPNATADTNTTPANTVRRRSLRLLRMALIERLAEIK